VQSLRVLTGDGRGSPRRTASPRSVRLPTVVSTRARGHGDASRSRRDRSRAAARDLEPLTIARGQNVAAV
jgi:hypothetical protein